MNLEIKINEAEIAKLAKIPVWLQLNAIDKALKAMATPIIAKAKAIAPSSRETGTRQGWSAKYKNDPKWQIDSGREIGSKTVKTKNGAIAFVGVRHPRGNKQQFNQAKDGREVVYWGRRTGLRYRPPYRFMDRAFDETRSQQDSAFVASIQSSFGSMNLG